MAQNVVIKAAGLHSNNNPYSAAPNGSMSEAVNVVIDKTEVVQPRRGFYQYSETLMDTAQQLVNYKDRVLAHVVDEILYDSDNLGDFVAFAGDAVDPIDDVIKIRSIEANGNLYFTSLNGIKKISARTANDFATVEIEPAGMAKAVNLNGVTSFDAVGFLDPNSKVSYRLVFGRNDLNDNLLLGSPSPILTIYNVSETQSCTANLSFTLPMDVRENDFYQIYRTALSTETFPTEPSDPGDEMYLVLEDIITAADIANGSVGIPLTYAVRIIQDLTYTAVTEGTDGNDVSITYVNGGALSVTVLASAITVTLNTGVSTATQVKTAFDLVPAAVALASVAVTGTGATVQIAATIVNLTGGTGYILNDITPDDFRRAGALLYTNPVSGEGITQANEKPPFAKDICVYKGFTWLANTQTVQRLNLNFVSIEDLVTATSNFTVTDGVTSTVYTFQGTKETFTIVYTATAANFYNGGAATAKYFKLHSAMDERKYIIWFKKSAVNDVEPSIAGYINIEVDISDAGLTTSDQFIAEAITTINAATDDFNLSVNTGTRTLTVACSNNGDVSTVPATTISITGSTWAQDGSGTGEDAANKKIFLPRVPAVGENGPSTAQQLEQVAKSMVNVITQEDPLVNVFYMSSFNDVPGQMLFENKDTTGDAFWVKSNTSADTFNPTVPAATSAVISTNEVRPNRIYFSKYQQPDAFPLVNYLDVGAKDREIKRIVPLRDSLFIIKEDGIYKLSGDTAVAGTNNFNIAEFDFSVQVLAPNSAVVLNNQIYALATQGVVSISDTIVSIISRPIENQILQIVKAGTNYKAASFGVSYESDRSYLLFTVATTTDEVATQVFRYNTFTNTWTKWAISKTCGIVNFADDKLYLGASDLHIIEKERKQLNRYDYADREHSIEIPASALDYGNKRIKVSSLAFATAGDVFLQRQYLTISQFNRLLIKLDNDTGVNDTNYYALLGAVAGDNLRSKIVALATKLDADTGITDADYSIYVGSYSYTITANTAADPTVLSIGTNSIYATRYVTISGSNSTPDIDGSWQITAHAATTVTIDEAVTIAGTTGTIQTDANNFLDIQACFNLITAKLNLDTSVMFTNYDTSEGYYDFESIILDKIIITNEIVVPIILDYIFGEVTIFDKIDSFVVYNPQFFGDPSTEKQVSEGTIMFENSNFSTATISYASDRSPSFAEIEFDKAGIGNFGMFGFGGGSSMNFGGISAPVPLRTYIPLAKQRCRFINVKFEHGIALQSYAIYGISLKFRPYNTRVAK